MSGVAFLPFKRARAIVRKLKLGSKKEWKEWSKNGERPNNIPGKPNVVYRDAGWISITDWLGQQSLAKRQPAPQKQRAAGRKRKRSAERKDEDEECAVCLELLSEADEVRTLPCSHHFCAGCVERVAKKAMLDGGAAGGNRVLIQCPMCRASVRVLKGGRV